MPKFKTTIVILPQRKRKWHMLSSVALNELVAFFRERQGEICKYKFKDWDDACIS